MGLAGFGVIDFDSGNGNMNCLVIGSSQLKTLLGL